VAGGKPCEPGPANEDGGYELQPAKASAQVAALNTIAKMGGHFLDVVQNDNRVQQVIHVDADTATRMLKEMG
jgi:hypothetical protein